jgi:F-type H+-transporting ATPase subunit gamma
VSEQVRIEQRIRHLDELGEVVGAMRTLAASHVHQARARIAATQAYLHTLEAALARVVTMLPPVDGPRGDGGACAWIVLGGEHGFCGDFAGRLVSRLGMVVTRGDLVMVLGSRSAALAREHGIEIEWAEAMVSHAGGVLAMARDAVDALYERIVADRVRRVGLIHGEGTGTGSFEVRVQGVLPLDLETFRRDDTGPSALSNLPHDKLAERLVDEYVLARVVHAGTASLAAENGARLLATTAAGDAVAERVEMLRGQSRRLRQSAITAELAELIGSGAFDNA